jgi:ribosome maturation factor RimP
MAVDIISRVEEFAGPVLESVGLELVEAQYRRESSGWVLRLFIDRAEESVPGGPAGSGVTLVDCVHMSREIGRLLDIEEVMGGAYTLEVSSPGLDRPLTKPKDFLRFAGRQVKVKAMLPEGRRKFKGTLLGIENESISIEVGGEVLKIPYDQAERVQLVPVVEWDRAS